MVSPLPHEIIGIIVFNAGDRLNLRHVNTTFRDEVDTVIRSYEDELCDMLRACRISTDNVPKKWLMRYAHDKSKLPPYECCSCQSQTYEIGECQNCSVPNFPWRKVLQGPVLTLVFVITIVLF